MSQKRQISFVVGTYAKLLDQPESGAISNKFKWACVVIPFANDSGVFLSLVDRVTFKLHESFAKPLRVSECAPFFMTEEGWGEFTINVEIFVRGQVSVKLSQYLKLNGEGPVVVNETVDSFSVVLDVPAYNITDPPVRTPPSIPIFMECDAFERLSEYSSIVDMFFTSNREYIDTRKQSLASLVTKALHHEEELLKYLSKVSPKRITPEVS